MPDATQTPSRLPTAQTAARQFPPGLHHSNPSLESRAPSCNSGLMSGRALMLFLWVISASAAFGQTTAASARPGLYRGLLTVSSPQYGASNLPIKRSVRVVARVSPNSGQIKAVIRADPQVTLRDPIRQLVLDFDGKDQAYDLLEKFPDGSTLGAHANVSFRRDAMTIESVISQTSEFGSISSAVTMRIVIHRIGP
jgi:hypothetical protein